MRQYVSQSARYWRNAGGKSEPQSTIHPTERDATGGGEKMRAPNAEKDPAPPGISRTGGVGGGKCISSVTSSCQPAGLHRDKTEQEQEGVDRPIMNMPRVTKSMPILRGLPLRCGLGLSTSMADSSAAMAAAGRKGRGDYREVVFNAGP